MSKKPKNNITGLVTIVLLVGILTSNLTELGSRYLEKYSHSSKVEQLDQEEQKAQDNEAQTKKKSLVRVTQDASKAFCIVSWEEDHQPNASVFYTSKWTGMLVQDSDGRVYAATTPHKSLKVGMEVEVSTTTGTFQGKVVSVHPSADAGLIRLSFQREADVFVAPVAGEAAPRTFGETLTVYSGNNPRTSQFIIRQMMTVGTTSGTSQSILLNRPMWQGGSGSGCVNEKGELCGLVWGSLNGQSYMTPARYIRELLEQL